MAFDVEAARKAGYSDAEIASHLAGKAKFDAEKAKSAGYSDSELIAYLVPKVTKSVSIPGAQEVAPTQEPTIGERLIGAGEAALTTATGATGGTLGMIGGTLGGLAGAILSGQFGTPQAAQMVDEAAAEGARRLTYEPRTSQGQEQAQAVGQAVQQLIPIAGVAPALAVTGARPVAPTRANVRGAVEGTIRDVAGEPAATAAARTIDAAARLPEQVTQAANQAANRIREATGYARPQETAGSRGSVGAAGADVATQRVETAQQLPVPMQLTRGQATRDFEQLRFEGETAKSPQLGAPLRERQAVQNEQLAQQFQVMIDRVGATAPTKTEAARVLVDQTLVPVAAKLKNEYRTKYNAADKAGQMDDPVSLQPLADYLNSNRAGRSSAPILGTIADELNVQGVGSGSLAEGSLTGATATLKQAENLRKSVNKFVKDTDPNDLRVASEIKGVIDQITEGKGGGLYKEARQAYQRYNQLFENNAIVRDLMATRRGTADRQVALEKVIDRVILTGDRESLSMLRRTLDVGDQKLGFRPGVDGPGAQAWKEVKGATLRHLVDEATAGVGTDVAGNVIFSADKLNRAVSALERGNKLEFILGRKGAQTVRDINEISKVVKTLPPGSVNTSNTATVLLAALGEAGATGALTGLPVPAISLLKAIGGQIKDAKIRARVQQSLNAAQP